MVIFGSLVINVFDQVKNIIILVKKIQRKNGMKSLKIYFYVRKRNILGLESNADKDGLTIWIQQKLKPLGQNNRIKY